ncbi:uncharacterized protein TNCV_3883971 [Trichonephila clavipes]|nr:uncharacterized protein TNCV_3883971 [Trichonephila clavipes]
MIKDDSQLGCDLNYVFPEITDLSTINNLTCFVFRIKLKLSGAKEPTVCPSQYTWPLGAEVHEQMSRSGGQPEVRPPVFMSPRKLGTHLSTHCHRDERLSRPCPAWE